MTPDKERFEELCAAYALGVLEEEEQALLQAGLRSGGEEYSAILRGSLDVIDHLHSTVPQRHPDRSVRKRLLRRIAALAQDPLRTPLIDRIALAFGFGNPRLGFSLTLVLLCLAGAGGVTAYRFYRLGQFQEQRIISYGTALREQQQQLTALQTEMEKDRAMMEVLRSPKIAVVMMNGLEVNPAGYGKVIWDPVRKVAILQVSKLPAVPSDKDYQLWYLDKEKRPVSAGVFAVSAGEEDYFSVTDVPLPDSAADITAFAVTMEPKGGVPQPTGAMYLLGSPAVSR